jgi:hypothetical protein
MFNVVFQFKHKSISLPVERVPSEGEIMYWDVAVEHAGIEDEYFSGHFIVSKVQTSIEGDYPKHTVSYSVHLVQ